MRAAERADCEQVSALVADVATLRDDVVGIDGNLSTAASVTVVESTVTTAIDDFDELAGHGPSTSGPGAGNTPAIPC